MITLWKKASSIEYTASWNGRRLALRWEGDCWRLYTALADAAKRPDVTVLEMEPPVFSAPLLRAQEQRCRDCWVTVRQAQEAVDRAQQRIVAHLLATGVQITPRKRSVPSVH